MSWQDKAKLKMLEKGIKQKELASVFGVSPGAVSHYFTGRRTPDLEQMKNLAERIGCSLDWLLSGDINDFFKENKQIDTNRVAKSQRKRSQDAYIGSNKRTPPKIELSPYEENNWLNRAKFLIKESKISNQSLRKIFEVKTDSELSEYLNGKKQPTVEQIFSLSRALEVGPELIMTGVIGPWRASDPYRTVGELKSHYSTIDLNLQQIQVIGSSYLVEEKWTPILYGDKNTFDKLMNQKNYYFRCFSSSIGPRIKQNDLLLIDTTVTPKHDDEILIISKDNKAMVNKLMHHDEKETYLLSINSYGYMNSINNDDIKCMHVIKGILKDSP